ncbi:MAG: type II toxin-antitoxin system HicB family antitoxin [Puniceicoccales bacterium]|jgi:predicted RNase H-like HicB family nuclease|nr:type II toxin-antitoxin system HicB family antitoxin [Puniceicoccales bacterium]
MKTSIENLYTVTVRWDSADECYYATAPALPGIMTDGETPETALREIRPVIRATLEMKHRHGDDIPEPDGVSIEQIKKLLPLMNLSKLAREAGINKHTLSARVRRTTPFPRQEAIRVKKVFDNVLA